MSITYRCSGIQCDTEGIRTEDKREYEAHIDKYHYVTCRCGELAAYAYNPGAPGSYYYCAEHADDAWDDNDTFRERVYRITRQANEDADRLPADHPIEKKLADA